MRVGLRQWGRKDRDLLTRANEPEMTVFLGGPETDGEVDARHERYLHGWQTGTARAYRVDVDDEPAALIGAWHVEHDDTPAWEVGWSVLPEWQGRGVARSALRLLLRELVADGSRGLVVAYPSVENAASNALCRGAGFEPHGTHAEQWRGAELTFAVWTLDISPLDLAGRTAVVDERFTTLDPQRWWPYYTPHWSSRGATAARYGVGSGLELRIEADTAPWAPTIDGDTRVSHVQTGQYSGAEGSSVGQHRFRSDLVVVEEQPVHRGLLVHFGVIEVRMTAVRHPDAMVACWPIGFEEQPDRSGEICIAEIFGSDLDDTGGWVGVGVKPQNDPRLRADFDKIRVEGDLTRPHDYAVEWGPTRLRFFIDGRWVKTVVQSIDYPVQLMLDVYEFARPDGTRDTDALPHTLRVEHVRVFFPAPPTSSRGQDAAATTSSTASP